MQVPNIICVPCIVHCISFPEIMNINLVSNNEFTQLHVVCKAKIF